MVNTFLLKAGRPKLSTRSIKLSVNLGMLKPPSIRLLNGFIRNAFSAFYCCRAILILAKKIRPRNERALTMGAGGVL